jgi:uncharacterized protein
LLLSDLGLGLKYIQTIFIYRRLNMPASLSYPGVYVEEIPSGVRTITGVATSIAAFVGWAPKGSTDRAELVLSWIDYERKFGGLDRRSLLGYAVYHFFSNGGQQAYIIRVVNKSVPAPDGGVTAAPDTSVAISATKTLDGKLAITAKNEGSWGNNYAIVTKKQVADASRFRLTIVNIGADPKGFPVEVFENLSMNPNDSRYVVTVLENESVFVNAAIVANASTPPNDTIISATGDDQGKIPSEAKLAGGQDGNVLEPKDTGFKTALQPVGGVGGVFFLDRIYLFNILCVPGLSDTTALSNLQEFCHKRRAFLIADCDESATFDTLSAAGQPNSTITGNNAINSAFYFPWILAPDPLQENRPRAFPPCGFVAGLFARTDTTRGVWKAPAGTDASLTGTIGVKVPLTNNENGVLNPKAINCIRGFPVYGTVIWGSRTLQGNDERGSEWKYVPVRRTALFIEESLYRATQWVVFEPNDEPLWAQIRLNIGAFMNNLFRQGAFQGRTPQEAYFVKCSSETTTQNDINLGIVNIVVGFAPLKPAEFVVLKFQQIAGQIAT